MPLPTLGDLTWLPALDHPELLAPAHPCGARRLGSGRTLGSRPRSPSRPSTRRSPTRPRSWPRYRVPMNASVNCVVIQGRRGETERVAAAAIRADMRADVNGVVKRLLDVRKCSFMGLDEAVARSAMEYGGITPVGLPDDWRVLVDERVGQLPAVVIGSGIRAPSCCCPASSWRATRARRSSRDSPTCLPHDLR